MAKRPTYSNEADYVVVGSGSSGAIVAGRLAQSGASVILIEAGKSDDRLDFLLRHGTFMEKQAEMVTDGLRALLLEASGYRTKVFEFVSDAHTPKNNLIVAEKDGRAGRDREAILRQIAETKAMFGIERHYLEGLLGL